MDTAVNGEYLSSFSVHEFKYEAGWNFAYGAVPDAGFITTLPPNAPSCKWDTGSYNVLRSATSYHSGGVNVSLLDGAVKFVSDTIDSGTGDRFPAATPVGVVSGQSPFGIWGAYGSRDGGEAASLP
jgi:prepilin-type processing-associated H-X9-DG protein